MKHALQYVRRPINIQLTILACLHRSLEAAEILRVKAEGRPSLMRKCVNYILAKTET